MATKSYGDAPRRLYVEAAEAAAQEFAKTSGGGPIEFAKDLGRNALTLGKGLPETALTMGTSVAADVPAGFVGMGMAGTPEQDRPHGIRDPETGSWMPSIMATSENGGEPMLPSDAIERTQNALTWQPRGESSKRVMGMMGNAMQAITDPISRGIDYGLEKGTEAGVPSWAMAAPLAALSGAIEVVPGPQKPAGKAKRFVAAAEAAADADFARAALANDPTAGGRALTLRDNPEADMSRVAQDVQGEPKWDETIPETGVEQTLGRRDADVPANDGGMPPGRQRGSIQDTGAGKRVAAAAAPRVAAENVLNYSAEIASGQPELTDMPPVNVETPGAKVSTMERRVGTTGQYRGAPRGTASPQKLGALRTKLKAALLRGVPGRNWYDRSSQAAVDLTAGREGLRDRYVGGIAVTSADTAVPMNAGFAIKGYNQMAAGDPISTGRYPVRMSKNMNAINDSRVGGEGVMLTDKVGPFWEANRLDPTKQANIRPTNDLWMARAFGYTQKDKKTGKFVEWSSGLGEAQHRFMDDEINHLVDIANKEKLGGFDDWTPERVQAAIWVDTKAAREGTSIERAATDFATDLDSRSVNITAEATPANALNHQPGVYGNEDRAKNAFDAQNEILTDDQGRNILATGANALTRPQITGAGVYQGQSNPVSVNRILGSQDTGVKSLDPSSRKLAETVASTEGMLRGQESVGYNFLRKPDKVGDANAAVVPQVDDVAGFQNKLDAVFGGDVIATPSEEGVRILKIDGAPFDMKQRKALQDIVGEKPEWKLNSGDLVGGFDEYKPSNYLNTIDDTVARNMDPNTRFAAKALEQLDDALAKEYPDAGPRNAVLQKTRKALAEGGIDKVRELVKQGILPAVVIGVLTGQAAAPSNPRQQT